MFRGWKKLEGFLMSLLCIKGDVRIGDGFIVFLFGIVFCDGLF